MHVYPHAYLNTPAHVHSTNMQNVHTHTCTVSSTYTHPGATLSGGQALGEGSAGMADGSAGGSSSSAAAKHASPLPARGLLMPKIRNVLLPDEREVARQAPPDCMHLARVWLPGRQEHALLMPYYDGALLVLVLLRSEVGALPGMRAMCWMCALLMPYYDGALLVLVLLHSKVGAVLGMRVMCRMRALSVGADCTAVDGAVVAGSGWVCSRMWVGVERQL